MGYGGFVMWFAAGMIITMFLDIAIDNSFILALIIGLWIGVMGAIIGE